MNPGNFYKVDLPDTHIRRMLDWDAKLKDQPLAVRRLAKSLGMDLNDLGGDLLAIVGKDEAGKQTLEKAGIRGIKYLDQQSRDAAQGTRNFVVFDPNNLTILERNQQPIKKESTRLVDNPDMMMMEVEDKKLATGGMIGKAVKSAIAARELEKQAILRAEAATKSAAKQSLMPPYNEAVKGQTQKQNPPSFEQWKAINHPEPDMAEGGAAYNTDPDMSDGGQMIQGAPFKRGGDVNLDAMYMAVNDAKFRRK
jgi:hypothetical protein